jgi:aminomethyltransferase
MLDRSPLHDWHVAHGAKMADFGGWEMPIEYPAASGGGVLAEHQAVRERVGLFDVSHLGKARISGAGARDFANSAFTNDLNRIVPGKAQYTMCCDAGGGVVDDLIAYLRGDDDVFLIPNAANTAEVVRRLQVAAPAAISVVDQHRSYGVFAVQGPLAADVLQAVGLPHELDYMAFADAMWNGADVIVCRTGYTGERGFEIVPRWEDAPGLWEALESQVAVRAGRVCGLASRDTLRTEMAYPLHGHELSLEITPVQARAGWAVGWKKETFWGHEALRAERDAGPRWVLRGLRATDLNIPRAGMQVSRNGAGVGEVTSGTFSPTLKVGIALALIAPEIVPGDQVVIDVRGREAIFDVVVTPFVESHVNA